ncbi:hypothetical protein M199_gp018 [Halogranum tailed virus 1]|uniref:Tail tube protein n=1 Tax=Halogranum tailed virus 1 TaxID=1273749 RepID=R4TME6_9CAUD|nr:hypothetical protein M199_gp018 [Halogranum tailed virus 1]AGM11348.1 hypothetical protein HGTV1_18 [Halogranum tailed virus 1]
MANKEEIGNDVDLFVGGNPNPFPITSGSYSEEPQTSNVQFNTSLTQSIVQTGIEYSGSFEHSGSNKELRDAIFGEQNNPQSSVVKKLDQLVFEDSEQTYTFKGVVIGSRSKDFPADDRTSVTYDFTAEELVVT